ncbi:MAG TPA: alanine--glyoxylate aminotransferase family protein [Gemmatimonadales bacterium]|jgi:aspartate aminotransferase-like enzyme
MEEAVPLLMTPGPTRVPERVLRAGARPMIHHRTAAFSAELDVALTLLGELFGTRERVLPVHTTGRGAMEAAICNLFSPGDAIAVACNGKFGEMWAGFAESYGVVVHRFATDWNRNADAAELAALLARHPDIGAVAVAYCDTSTGVRNDVASIARVAADRGILTMVDAVSALGGMPFSFDAWEIDVAVTASQKCLMASPGLAFVAMSAGAWRRAERATLPRNYWDFRAIRDAISRAKPETPGTTPVHLVLQVAESLRMMREEGFDAITRRHEAIAGRLRQVVAERSLAMQCPGLDSLAPTVTAIALPAGVSPRAVRDGLKARGILTAAGLDRFEATAFRIGHMGDIRMSDMERTIGALHIALDGVRAASAR